MRHIERAGILVHLVEPAPLDGSDPIDNYRVIFQELVEYNRALGERPALTVVSKGELDGADEVRERLSETLDREVLLISAVTGLGLNHLVHEISRLLDAERIES